QPEVQREHRRFDAETDDEENRRDIHQRLIFERRHLERQVGHVERAGDAIKDGNAGEEKSGSQDVHGHVLYRALDLRFAPAEGHQHERRDNNNLEPHVEVKDVAREKGAVEAHQQEMEDGEIPVYDAAARNAGGGEDRNGKPRKGGKQHQAAAEYIGHEGDAEGRLPTGRLHGEDAALPYGGEQPDGYQHADNAARNADDAVGNGFAPKEQQQDGREQVDKNGENNGIVNHISSSSGVFKS